MHPLALPLGELSAKPTERVLPVPDTVLKIILRILFKATAGAAVGAVLCAALGCVSFPT